MEKLFALLVESGAIYSAIWVSSLPRPTCSVHAKTVEIFPTQSGCHRGVPDRQQLGRSTARV